MAEACDLSGLAAAASMAQQQTDHLRHRFKWQLRYSGRPVIHTIHHFACTGGTVICKCLASMHRVALVSEVNPLSDLSRDFEPRDPLMMLERSDRPLTSEKIKEDVLGRNA